jgi:hypothetical protein
MSNTQRQLPATGAAVDLEGTLSSLRLQADALGELRLRCNALRDTRERSHAQLDAVTVAIDARIDECLLIAERAATADPSGEWRSAVTELERQLRTLGVLRSKVLALYGMRSDARCGS